MHGRGGSWTRPLSVVSSTPIPPFSGECSAPKGRKKIAHGVSRGIAVGMIRFPLVRGRNGVRPRGNMLARAGLSHPSGGAPMRSAPGGPKIVAHGVSRGTRPDEDPQSLEGAEEEGLRRQPRDRRQNHHCPECTAPISFPAYRGPFLWKLTSPIQPMPNPQT